MYFFLTKKISLLRVVHFLLLLIKVYLVIVVKAYVQKRKANDDDAAADQHPYGQTSDDMTKVS